MMFCLSVLEDRLPAVQTLACRIAAQLYGLAPLAERSNSFVSIVGTDAAQAATLRRVRPQCGPLGHSVGGIV